jgi:hypothetical protein
MYRYKEEQILSELLEMSRVPLQGGGRMEKMKKKQGKKNTESEAVPF